jgi:uncharacterized protein (DUF433 family)
MPKKGSAKSRSSSASRGTKRTSASVSSTSRRASGKRELIQTGGTDKRFVQHGAGGRLTERDVVAASPQTERRAKVTATSKAARGDRGNRKSVTRGSRLDEDLYVRPDATGAMRVGDSDVPLDSVLAAFHQGHSPEMIRAQFRSLRLEEIYGAIAYYLAHRKDVDAYLEQQDALWAQWRARSHASTAPVVQRLKSGGRAPATGPRTSP